MNQTTTTKVEVDASTDRFRELQAREPEKDPDEIVESALALYRDANKPWIALDEREHYVGGGRDG